MAFLHRISGLTLLNSKVKSADMSDFLNIELE